MSSDIVFGNFIDKHLGEPDTNSAKGNIAPKMSVFDFRFRCKKVVPAHLYQYNIVVAVKNMRNASE